MPGRADRVASSGDSSRVRTRRDRTTDSATRSARRTDSATRRDDASEMSDDEVKQEVKEEHINIKVRDMVRERASDASDARDDDASEMYFEMTTRDGIWTTGSTRR